MSLIFKQEIQWLSKVILPNILKNGRLLDNFEASLAETFKVQGIEISIIGPEEAYMLTQCYRAMISFEYDHNEYQRILIVKKTPEVSQDLYDSIQFDKLFHNEICFYTEVLPILQKLSDGQFAAPKYYYSEFNAHSAVIILGDFGADGWSVTKKRFGLSLEHARIAVKYLGRFHGFGYALKLDQRELFDSITSKLKEARFDMKVVNFKWGLQHRTTVKRAAQAVAKYHPEVDKEFVQKFRQLTHSYTGFGRQRVAPREPYATLCHGDYLRNNVAYKYDTDSSGNPLEIMMFDYQTMRLSSPMVDLSVFLALSLMADVRHENFESLFDDYCNALADSFRKHSKQEVPVYLSRSSLLKEYIKFTPYAVFIACYFLMELVDPPLHASDDKFHVDKSEEQIIQEFSVQGGETVNREVAHQIMEMFKLSREHNVQIDEDIDMTEWLENSSGF